MKITSSGKRYEIWLRGGFAHIKSAKRFEAVLRQAFVSRYGVGSDAGRSLLEMDSHIGMISQARLLDGK